MEADLVDSGHLAAFSRPDQVTAKLLEYVADMPEWPAAGDVIRMGIPRETGSTTAGGDDP